VQLADNASLNIAENSQIGWRLLTMVKLLPKKPSELQSGSFLVTAYTLEFVILIRISEPVKFEALGGVVQAKLFI